MLADRGNAWMPFQSFRFPQQRALPPLLSPSRAAVLPWRSSNRRNQARKLTRVIQKKSNEFLTFWRSCTGVVLLLESLVLTKILPGGGGSATACVPLREQQPSEAAPPKMFVQGCTRERGQKQCSADRRVSPVFLCIHAAGWWQLLVQKTPYNLQFSTSPKAQAMVHASQHSTTNPELATIEKELAWMPGSHQQADPVSLFSKPFALSSVFA
eukprot:352710-Rhodomonas_salina.1